MSSGFHPSHQPFSLSVIQHCPSTFPPRPIFLQSAKPFEARSRSTKSDSWACILVST